MCNLYSITTSQEAMRRLSLDPDMPAGIVLTKVPDNAPGPDLYMGYSR